MIKNVYLASYHFVSLGAANTSTELSKSACAYSFMVTGISDRPFVPFLALSALPGELKVASLSPDSWSAKLASVIFMIPFQF